MINKDGNLQIAHGSRPGKSAVLPLIISVIALLVSFASAYLAYSAAHISYLAKTEIELGIKQAQAGLEALKRSSVTAPVPQTGQ